MYSLVPHMVFKPSCSSWLSSWLTQYEDEPMHEYGRDSSRACPQNCCTSNKRRRSANASQANSLAGGNIWQKEPWEMYLPNECNLVVLRPSLVQENQVDSFGADHFETFHRFSNATERTIRVHAEDRYSKMPRGGIFRAYHIVCRMTSITTKHRVWRLTKNQVTPHLGKAEIRHADMTIRSQK